MSQVRVKPATHSRSTVTYTTPHSARSPALLSLAHQTYPDQSAAHSAGSDLALQMRKADKAHQTKPS